MEGPDAAVSSELIFQKWIPSLRGRDIEIDRGASRVWRREGLRSAAHSHLPCTEHDRSDILKGARQAYPVKCAQIMSHCCFFLTLVRLQRSGERHLVRFLKKMTALGLQPFLIYPAVIKLRHKGEQEKLRFPSESGGFYQLHVSAEVVCRSSAGGRRGSSGRCFSSSTGGAWRPGWTWPSCPEGDDSRMNMDAC